MRTGLSFLFMATDRDESDQDVYCQELELASMAEPLGFDSVWATEHHFTDYSMIPNPLQFLAHMAGRDQQVTLGAMVVVLPWHNPARLAGEIGMLDNLSTAASVWVWVGVSAGWSSKGSASTCRRPERCLTNRRMRF